MPARRSGFTLVELLVVITIILILATLVFAVFRGNSTDKARSAARIAQSAFLGAKDRALHAKDLRGVRLVRDTNSANASGELVFVNGLIYLQPLPMQTTGNTGGANPNNVSVIDPAGGTNYNTIQIDPPQAGTWLQQDQSGIWPIGQVQVRIPAGNGQWLQLQRQSASPPYWSKNIGGSLFLTLQLPMTTPIAKTSANASIDIQLGNDVLPFHQPIQLSNGCIIDLANSSQNVRGLAGIGTGVNSNVDIMFSPRGAVSGYLSGLGPLHFLLRDLKDATSGFNPFAVGIAGSANPDLNTGDRLILSIFPQTGLVQVFEMDPTDILTNGTAAGPPDGLADNPLNFAQQGKSAGR